MAFITLADLGQETARREANNDTKRALTKAAISVNEMSRSLPVQALPAVEAQARAHTSVLDSYQPWSEPTAAELALYPAVYWLWYGKWDSSQTVRANLQAAVSNIRVKTGAKEGAIHGRQTDVSLLAETLRETPGAVKDEAKEKTCATLASFGALTKEQCLRLMNDPNTSAAGLVWESIPTWAKVTGGAVIAGGVLFYFGGFISAAGNIAERLTRNHDRKR